MLAFDVIADFVGSLAVLTVLASGYGLIRRKVRDETLANCVTGALFGSVAILQMQMPVTVSDGVIIDMRNVPLALAAAFLGLPGAASALALAIGSRLAIGGTGTEAGITAMLYATVAGFAWHLLTCRNSARGLREYALLAAFTASSLCTVLLLPFGAAVAVLSDTAVLLLALYAIFVPLIAFMLDREMRLCAGDMAHAEQAPRDADDQPLSSATFRLQLRALQHREDGERAVAIARLRLCRARHIERIRGSAALSGALGILAARARSRLRHGDCAGFVREDSLGFPLTAAEVRDWGAIRQTLQAALTETPLQLRDGALTVRLDWRLIHLDTARAASDRPRHGAWHHESATAAPDCEVAALFDKADLIWTRGRRGMG